MTQQAVTLSELQTQRLREVNTQQANVSIGFGNMQSFELMQRAAKALSASTLVPPQYRAMTEVKSYGKVTGYEANVSGLPNCIVALNMAERMKADPLMIMQNLHIIEGRPSWSSAFIVAAINSCGRFLPLRYELTRPGEPTEVEYTANEWINKVRTEVKKKITVRHQSCVAWTVEKGTEIPKFKPEELRGKTILQLCREYGVPVLESPEVSIQMAIDEGWMTKNGSKWQTIPELMLRYRCASFFGRLYAPELLMGLHTTEETEDFIRAERDSTGAYAAVDVADLRNEAPQSEAADFEEVEYAEAAEEPVPTQEPVAEPEPEPEKPQAEPQPEQQPEFDME